MPEKQLELFHIVQVVPFPFDAPPLTASEPFSKPSRQDAVFEEQAQALLALNPAPVLGIDISHQFGANPHSSITSPTGRILAS